MRLVQFSISPLHNGVVANVECFDRDICRFKSLRFVANDMKYLNSHNELLEWLCEQFEYHSVTYDRNCVGDVVDEFLTIWELA